MATLIGSHHRVDHSGRSKLWIDHWDSLGPAHSYIYIEALGLENVFLSVMFVNVLYLKESYMYIPLILKTRYCPLSIARCDLLAAIFVMLTILRLLFVARIELFNNNGRLAHVKTKTTTRGTQSIMANTGPLRNLNLK